MIRRLLALAVLLAAPAAEAQTAEALFSAKARPSGHAAHPIGSHARGCLAGGAALPETGPTWQAMRLSRNRAWGHPDTIAFVERLSRAAVGAGWRGLYVGDIGQARGGPVSGHASHQTGLDVDIWMLPAQRLDLSRAERERLSSISVKAASERAVNANWTRAHHAILEAAARDPAVERIFVTPPAKLQMCADAGRDRAWLRKIRPWWSHDTHFHVRLACPAGAAGCVDPDPVPAGDGCADAVWWVTEALEPPDPAAPPPPPPRAPLRLADLPPQCAQVLDAR